MSEANPRLEKEEAAIDALEGKGFAAKIGTYTKLSGPGWLQGAITLGGGSLAGSLYLGSVGGYEMMWLQPLMMIFGIVMLAAIGYVALSTEKSPFHQINEHINPVLGWGWAIATLMANLVWAMPQFSLGTAAMQQNLGILPETRTGEYIGVGILFAIGFVVVWFYDSGSAGIKVFEMLLKAMVGIVVLSFVAVVLAMTFGDNGLPWGDILAGFIPNPKLLSEPASTLAPLIEASSAADYWHETVVKAQVDRMVAAAATAVGINMTFLLPFSMLKRGWNRKFRGLATFDLSLGLFIPFLLATSCVVIAAGTQFHGNPESYLTDLTVRKALVEEYTAADQQTKINQMNKVIGSYNGNLNKVATSNAKNANGDGYQILVEGQKTHDAEVAAKKAELAKTNDEAALAKLIKADSSLGLGKGPVEKAVAFEISKLKLEDKKLAATLIQRDAYALASSLEKLAGKGISQYVFGIGVVGMAVSTIIILMLINGFTICEMLGKPSGGFLHRFGCILPGITGAIGMLYLWKGDAKFYLAVPTSRFGMVLLPIAYIAFFCLMNNRKVLGDELPKGGKRIIINLLMLIGVTLALIGAGMSIFNDGAKLPGTEVRVRDIALGVLGGLAVLAVIVHFVRAGKKSAS